MTNIDEEDDVIMESLFELEVEPPTIIRDSTSDNENENVENENEENENATKVPVTTTTTATTSNSNSTANSVTEEEAALGEVQELLDAVEHLLVEGQGKSQTEEGPNEASGGESASAVIENDEDQPSATLKQQSQSSGESADTNTGTSSSSSSSFSTDAGTDEPQPSSASPSRKAARIVHTRLVEQLHKSRKRLALSLQKLQAQQRLRVPNLKSVKQHPAVLKTRHATRRIVTGSHHKRVRDFVVEPEVVRVLDKYTFTLGVLGIMTTEFVMLQCPQYFRYYYVAVMGPMLMLRYILYRRAKWQYFLMDFCYWVNGLCFVLVLFPNFQLPLIHTPSNFNTSSNSANNDVWWQTMFICANGPLLSAIVAWNNSLVFHSVDKVTSVYIHLFPALLSWCERWCNITNSTNKIGSYASSSMNTSSLGFMGAAVYPLLFYIVWQLTYLLQTEVLDRHKLDADPELATSLRFLAASTKSSVNKTVLKICRQLDIMGPTETFTAASSSTLKVKLIFVFGQLIYACFMCVPGWIWYNYHTAHTTILILVLTASIYNGARYYVQVFSKIYDKRYHRHQHDDDDPTSTKDNSKQGQAPKQETREEKDGNTGHEETTIAQSAKMDDNNNIDHSVNEISGEN